MAAEPVASSGPELADVQGLVARGYGELTAATFLLGRIEGSAAARGWLAGLTELVTAADHRPEGRAVQVAFTSQGLRRLGLGDDVVSLFANEFVDGMVSPHRSRTLGDIGTDAPEHWDWGGPGEPVDFAVLLYATDNAGLASLLEEPAVAFPAGVQLVRRLGTSDLRGREPFGFRDGISQPFVEGLSKQGPRAVTLKFGEFVLGYPNEYGRYSEQQLLDAAPQISKNGSYLVLRQLRQDVRGFWHYLDDAAGSDPERRTWLAAKLVGRWPGGASLTLSPERDDPGLAVENDFTYHGPDRHGTGCPLGAHVRRANPRDSLDPKPGTEKSLAINRRHRLLRRGREYGKQLTVEEALQPGVPGEEERGLHFVCLNGSIARQFEFVQGTWMNDPTFRGLYDDSDPITAPSKPFGGTFTIQRDGVRQRLHEVPRFVAVRGGAYFFLPSLTALRTLSSL